MLLHQTSFGVVISDIKHCGRAVFMLPLSSVYLPFGLLVGQCHGKYIFLEILEKFFHDAH